MMILELVVLWGSAVIVAAAFVARTRWLHRTGKIDAFDDLGTKLQMTALVAAMLTLPVVPGLP